MGLNTSQPAPVCPTTEELGCIECEVCDTVDDTCTPIKRRETRATMTRIETNSQKNKDRLLHLQNVLSALTDYDDKLTRDVESKKQEADAVGIEAQYWTDAKGLFDTCAADLDACTRSSHAETNTTTETQQKQAEVRGWMDSMEKDLDGEMKFALSRIDEFYSKCMERKGKEEFCGPEQCTDPNFEFKRCWGAVNSADAPKWNNYPRLQFHDDTNFDDRTQWVTDHARSKVLLRASPALAGVTWQNITSEEECNDSARWHGEYPFASKKWTNNIEIEQAQYMQLSASSGTTNHWVGIEQPAPEPCEGANRCYVWPRIVGEDGVFTDKGREMHDACMSEIREEKITVGLSVDNAYVHNDTVGEYLNDYNEYLCKPTQVNTTMKGLEKPSLWNGAGKCHYVYVPTPNSWGQNVSDFIDWGSVDDMASDETVLYPRLTPEDLANAEDAYKAANAAW